MIARLRRLELRLNRLSCRLLGEHIFDRGRCACGAFDLRLPVFMRIRSAIVGASATIGAVMLPFARKVIEAAQVFEHELAKIRITLTAAARLEEPTTKEGPRWISGS